MDKLLDPNQFLPNVKTHVRFYGRATHPPPTILRAGVDDCLLSPILYCAVVGKAIKQKGNLHATRLSSRCGTCWVRNLGHGLGLGGEASTHFSSGANRALR